MDQNDDPEFLKFLAGFGLDGFYTNLTDDQRQELTQKGETHGPLPRAGRAITKFALPPVFLLGVVGNLLSILVLARCARPPPPPLPPHPAPPALPRAHSNFSTSSTCTVT